MDFRKAVCYAEELEHTAKKLRRMGKEEAPEIFRTGSFWEGDAASAWNGGGVRLGENIQRSADRLNDAAEVLRRTARRIYEAEMRAYRLARERNYQS